MLCLKIIPKKRREKFYQLWDVKRSWRNNCHTIKQMFQLRGKWQSGVVNSLNVARFKYTCEVFLHLLHSQLSEVLLIQLVHGILQIIPQSLEVPGEEEKIMMREGGREGGRERTAHTGLQTHTSHRVTLSHSHTHSQTTHRVSQWQPLSQETSNRNCMSGTCVFPIHNHYPTFQYSVHNLIIL